MPYSEKFAARYASQQSRDPPAISRVVAPMDKTIQQLTMTPEERKLVRTLAILFDLEVFDIVLQVLIDLDVDWTRGVPSGDDEPEGN